MSEKPLSARETAEYLGISRATLSRLVSRGSIGHYRVGDRPFFSPAHIAAYLASVERPARPALTRRRAAAV